MKFLSQLIGYLLTFIYGLVGNYGWSIIILTLIVRILLVPLYAKQIKYTNAISAIQDEVNEINKRYAKNRDELNTKLSELYEENGISPASGCLPMLIQMPIILGMFSLLRAPLDYIEDSAMIMAVHEGFMWITDLCQPDALILPLLAAFSTYLTTALSSNDSSSAMGGNAALKYFSPVMIFLMGRSFPSGLALYWAVGNAFTIVQTVLLNKKSKQMKLETAARKQAKKNIEKEFKAK